MGFLKRHCLILIVLILLSGCKNQITHSEGVGIGIEWMHESYLPNLYVGYWNNEYLTNGQNEAIHILKINDSNKIQMILKHNDQIKIEDIQSNFENDEITLKIKYKLLENK